jgi:hypothetical protein
MGAGAPLRGFAELLSQATTESITFYIMRKTMENCVFGAYDPFSRRFYPVIHHKVYNFI